MSSSNTICVSQEGPANALALNKDCTQVVIAGRNGKLITFYTYLLFNSKPSQDKVNLIYNFRFSVQSVLDRRKRIHGSVQLASRQKLKSELLFNRRCVEQYRGEHAGYGSN